MSIIKSFSVGAGDMFYIKHDSDNFTIIDCCLNYDENSKAAKKHILSELQKEMEKKGVVRFISTHPDEDHISGLQELDQKINIQNFYRVNNKACKNGEESVDFITYKRLRDDPRKQFALNIGCRRKWMNESDNERKDSGLNCLWPITSNKKYQDALQEAANGKSPNNISPVIKYTRDNFSFLWMGDMETDMQKEFDDNIRNSHVTIVFAPHHGRKSGYIPTSLMKKLSPKLIVVGEAPSDDLIYYNNQNTITQNSAGDILFDVNSNYIDIFVSNSNYTKRDGMTINRNHSYFYGLTYLGSIAEDNI